MGRYEALQEAISMADTVIDKYSHFIKYPLSFSAELLIMHIAISENIHVDSFPFKNNYLCGMLLVDEHEKTIVYNTRHSQERRNFTLAHELGHYFLHSEKQNRFHDRSKNLSDDVHSIIEMQANAFASHLIIPQLILLNMLNNNFNFFKISKVTRVSYDALYWILVNFLKQKLNIRRDDAILVVEDYKDYSTGSVMNLVHHNFAKIFQINTNNAKRIIGNLKRGEKPYRFKRNLSGDIVGIED